MLTVSCEACSTDKFTTFLNNRVSVFRETEKFPELAMYRRCVVSLCGFASVWPERFGVAPLAGGLSGGAPKSTFNRRTRNLTTLLTPDKLDAVRNRRLAYKRFYSGPMGEESKMDCAAKQAHVTKMAAEHEFDVGLLLVHCMFGSSNQWQPAAVAAAQVITQRTKELKEKYDSINAAATSEATPYVPSLALIDAVDLRNHGNSFRSECMSMRAMVGDLRTHLSSVTQEYRSQHGRDIRWIILGHSLGGHIAMELYDSSTQALDIAATEEAADASGSTDAGETALLTFPGLESYSTFGTIVVDTVPGIPAANLILHFLDCVMSLKRIDLVNLKSPAEAEKMLVEKIEEKSLRRFLLSNLYKVDNSGNSTNGNSNDNVAKETVRWGWKANLDVLEEAIRYGVMWKNRDHTQKITSSDGREARPATTDVTGRARGTRDFIAPLQFVFGSASVYTTMMPDNERHDLVLSLNKVYRDEDARLREAHKGGSLILRYRREREKLEGLIEDVLAARLTRFFNRFGLSLIHGCGHFPQVEKKNELVEVVSDAYWRIIWAEWRKNHQRDRYGSPSYARNLSFEQRRW